MYKYAPPSPYNLSDISAIFPGIIIIIRSNFSSNSYRLILLLISIIFFGIDNALFIKSFPFNIPTLYPMHSICLFTFSATCSPSFSIPINKFPIAIIGTVISIFSSEFNIVSASFLNRLAPNSFKTV